MSKTLKSVDYGLEKIFDGAQDFLPLLGTDFVEFYVGNAKQAAHFYKTAFPLLYCQRTSLPPRVARLSQNAARHSLFVPMPTHLI